MRNGLCQLGLSPCDSLRSFLPSEQNGHPVTNSPSHAGHDDPARGLTQRHRDLYPAQYAHPLCGLRVRVENATDDAGAPLCGIVERVVTSRFGRLAILAEYGAEQAWLASACRPVDCFTLNGVEVTLAEFLADNLDLEPAEVEAVQALQPGEEMSFGGGAAPLFILRRELPGWPGRPRVEKAGHAALFVVRAPTGGRAAGPFASRASAEWNARMQEREWWRCPATALWFATDEMSTIWMCPTITYPMPADNPDFTSILLATEASVEKIAADPAWVSTALRQQYGRSLPASPQAAGWVFCPVIGWYVRGADDAADDGLLATPALHEGAAIHDEDSQPLSTLARQDSALRIAFVAWIYATFGVSLDDRFNEPPALGWTFHEYEARLAASSVLAGVVGARILDREDSATSQMVFAYIPLNCPDDYGEVDAVVVEPSESGAWRTLDICIGTGMHDERLTVSLDDLRSGPGHP
jgi:hypothetical protein